MDRSTQRTEKNIHFGMKCIKYMLILLNVLYLMISFLMISGATTLKVIFGEYYYVVWSSRNFGNFSNLWIATGCFLLALSLFGIVAVVRESTMLTNIYGIVLSLNFILQMAAVVVAFTLITQSERVVYWALSFLMGQYAKNFDYTNTMNWIQTTFQCCGKYDPSDWNDFGQFSTTITYTVPWWETTERYPYTTVNEIFPTPYETATTTVSPPQLDRMLQPCCTRGSSYENLPCGSYFNRGCHGPLHEILAESVLMIGSSALVIGVVQILGIICAFMLVRVIRRSKTHRDIKKWAIHQSMDFDRPAYVDGLRYPETGTDEVKHI